MLVDTADEAVVFAQAQTPAKRLAFEFPNSVRELLRRLLCWADVAHQALISSRHRHAESEIRNYVRLQGGFVTDRLEREIERRFLAA